MIPGMKPWYEDNPADCPVGVVPPRGRKWTPTEHLLYSPCYVYGDEDLQRRKDAAKAAGVTLRVRPAPSLNE